MPRRREKPWIVTVSSTGENALPQVHERLVREYLERKAREEQQRLEQPQETKRPA